jgi:hypothetical protein
MIFLNRMWIFLSAASLPFFLAASLLIFRERRRTLPLAVPNDQHGGDIMGSQDQHRWKPLMYRDFIVTSTGTNKDTFYEA